MSNSFNEENEPVEMENLASIAENLVYQLPGCTDLMIRKTIQEVYRDFCRRSCCLCGRRHFRLEKGQASFAVSPMFGGMVESITFVRYNRRNLGCVADYNIRSGNPPVVCLAPRLVPDNDVIDCNLPEIELQFVEIPKMNSERIPSWFVNKHGDDICAGVLAKLMSMTGKAWSDAAQAGSNRIIYENAVGESRIRYYSGAEYGNGDCGLGVDASDLI